MKTHLLAILIALSGLVHADFETWTNAEGKEARLNLIQVSEVNDEKVGTFKMSNGRSITLKSSQLDDESAQRLNAWKDEITAATTGSSVFDDILDGNLVALDDKGKRLKKYSSDVRPEKYYLFYYTASWCPPCQKFTPELVKFYNDKKSDEFEIILITSDSSKDAMQDYATDKQMTWPHLKMSKVKKFKKEFKHPGGGIPNLVLCDPSGKIIKSSYVSGKYMGPNVVMHHLGTLLGK